MKKVIITGANSFVGSAIVKECVKNGVEVIAVVRNENSNIDSIKNLNNVRIVYCQLSNIQNLENLILDRDVDAFYHLAWEGVSGELRSDYTVQLNNIKYTCNAMELCKLIKCNKFIFANSIMSYESLSVIDNKLEPTPQSTYSVSKLTADYMLQPLATDITYLSVIISNIYGSGENSSRFINTALKKLINKEHLPCTQGNQMYDFIYIADAAQAFFEIGNKCNISKKYYLGSQNPRPLKEFLEEMKNCIDPNIKLGYGEILFNNGEVDYNQFDLYGIKNDTGFVPKIDFKTGILKTIEFLKK